jgi:hypothetical protein
VRVLLTHQLTNQNARLALSSARAFLFTERWMSKRSPLLFKETDLKHAIRSFQDMGLPIGGVEILLSGGFRVLTAAEGRVDSKEEWADEWTTSVDAPTTELCARLHWMKSHFMACARQRLPRRRLPTTVFVGQSNIHAPAGVDADSHTLARRNGRRVTRRLDWFDHCRRHVCRRHGRLLSAVSG